MIDQATGMKSGERYRVENVERAHQFPGFFQDGKYYLGPELLTAVGWLEGTRFIYDSLDAAGEPVFPNRVAGTIEGLTMTLVDGTTLELSRIEASDTIVPIAPGASGTEQEAPDSGAWINCAPKAEASSGNLFEPPSGRKGIDGGRRKPKDITPLLIVAAALGIFVGFTLTHSRRGDR
ncbi:hypothetical protein A3L25_013140 [Pseudomonas putida]|uniref:Short chain dehydrogenase n=1 Tax=Pseudomonas putida TaxID=303 RepID=A0AAP9N073_PSEPU|nr:MULTISPECIES: hypothetical protein [Pseudomonas]MCE0879736.1 hypothetical protein [Pseudomonas putida]MDF3873134.1 hypothetical protein [Pseudomonas putida]MDF3879429.1 hypothetical protein [Pseudomonas putida]MDH4842453.1 hypothetical protein [Pseudomonas sp. BN605]MDH4858188.1 hypothetical protein [Pseudomonas sp. BN505]